MRPSLISACCLSLLGALSAQDEGLQADINNALDSARPALMGHLKQATNQTTRPGELALVLLAAIHDGVDQADPAMKKAIERLAAARIDQTYDLALRLMVMEATPSFPNREKEARDDAKKLLKNRDSGAFGYRARSGRWDLSNTQYAALGLRAAKAMGVKVERRVWQQLAQEIGAQQGSYGGFGYQRQNAAFPGYASMTAAGIAVLAVCRQALGEEDKRKSTLTQRINRGWQWFERNLETIGSREERWSYYFHYGLERAAILCDVERIGKVSWDARGARMLVDDQLSGGGWSSPNDGRQGGKLNRQRGTSVSTAFAVLFLRRKFQKLPGPITPHIVTLPAIGPNSKAKDVHACAAELKRRGKEALPDVLRALRSDIENQRRAASMALVAITGKDFGYDSARVEAANSAAIKQAELWYLRNR